MFNVEVTTLNSINSPLNHFIKTTSFPYTNVMRIPEWKCFSFIFHPAEIYSSFLLIFFFLLQNTHKMSFIFESRFSLAENMFLLLIMKIFPDLFQVSSSFTGEKMLHLRLSGGCFKSFRSYSILEDQNGWLPRNDDVDRTQEFLAVFFFFGRYIWSFARRKALAMNDLWCYFNRVIFGSHVRCSQSFFFSFKK